MPMMRPGLKKFVCRSLLALLPIAAYLALYIALDPYRVVRPYHGISIAPGDTLERTPNKRYVAIEGLKYYNPERHYDSFIFGSSISSNFMAREWKRHLPEDASVYHFTEGAQVLEGIRDELRYLTSHGYPVRHVMLVMEDEMFSRPKRYGEMPFVPHWDVSPAVTRLDFHKRHFNAFRDPDVLLYNLNPTPAVVSHLLEDGKMTTVPSGRDERLNEDYSRSLDSVILRDPDAYYATMPWLVEMQPLPNPMPLSIGSQAEQTLHEIAALLDDARADYLVIVPPRFRSQPLSALDHALLCEIMGEERVHDFSDDPELIHDLHSYYDGVHILTHRCSQLIDRCYRQPALRMKTSKHE